ncbi:hypothetical protein YC2023_080851 [Brassica napus]|uniref:(rape) hypothetical protein n=1 Tax=Brassica napus TaxID=3708 RepID=A0A816QS94_BRANA|nr:unnamed protein product [Brassica napus]
MEKPPPRDQTGFEIDQSRFSNSPSGESLEYLSLLKKLTKFICLISKICGSAVRACCQRQQEVGDHTPRLLLLLPKER